jgi:hypothetical protein
MTPEQEIEYQKMKMEIDKFKADSIKLHKFYKSLVRFIPTIYMVKHLEKKKTIKRNWDIKANI